MTQTEQEQELETAVTAAIISFGKSEFHPLLEEIIPEKDRLRVIEIINKAHRNDQAAQAPLISIYLAFGTDLLLFNRKFNVSMDNVVSQIHGPMEIKIS